MKLFRTIPLFGVMLIAYNLFLIYSLKMSLPMNRVVHAFTLPSGVVWGPTVDDFILFSGLAILYIELIKSTRTSNVEIVEHTLSFFAAIAYMIEFLMSSMVANSTFILLGCMALIDVIAGFTITITAARKDFSVG